MALDDPSRTDVSGTDGWLTTPQVAEVLGVKRETVYAYVSRGILHRRLALDGRTSLFDRNHVEEVRRGARGTASGELRTVLATAITRIAEGSVLIRGRELVELIGDGWGFESVADLIWQTESAEIWSARFEEPPGLRWGDDWSPSVLDRFRIATAVAAGGDPLRRDLNASVVRRVGPRLIQAMVLSLPLVGSEVEDTIGAPTVDPPMAIARLLWPRLTPTAPSGTQLRALDTALALLADHGLAASTFAVRIAASVRADPYAAVGAGLGAVDGPLHGSASARVHRSLVSLASGEDVRSASSALDPHAGSLPGFGHTIYRRDDPRFGVLRDAVRTAWPADGRCAVFDDFLQAMGSRTDAPPNVDLALGHLTWMAGMSPEAGEAIFAVARCAGWLGHVIEEYGERPLRLRPKSHYVGPLPVGDRPDG